MDRHDNENNVAPPPPARAEVPFICATIPQIKLIKFGLMNLQVQNEEGIQTSY